MVDEFLIGGLSGAGITGVSTLAGKAIGGKVNPSLQSDGKAVPTKDTTPEETPKSNEVVGQLDEDF